MSLFLARGEAVASPYEAIERCVERLRAAVGGSAKGTLQGHFDARGIRGVVLVDALGSDGAIKPLGSRFADGFTVEVKAGLTSARRRFTEAHELCHTFFYERVPEVKFRPHERDPREESLCNYGAGALLIPAGELGQRAKNHPISLAALEALAGEYGVALGTMFLRLRQLGLWDGHLSLWHRSAAGRFYAAQAFGWRGEGEWSWASEDVLDQAWEGRPRARTQKGRAFVYCEDRAGRKFAKPIHYELRRRGRVIVVLSSDRALGPGETNLPLFGPLPAGR